MALADVVEAKMVRIWLSQTPTGLTNRLCAMQTASFNQTKETADRPVPDCLNPMLPKTIKRSVVSVDKEITGTLLYEPTARARLQALMDLAQSTYVCFEIPSSAAGIGHGYYGGRWHLTQFNIVAEGDDFVTAEVTWLVDGPAPWAPL
jgi:hypothetical protein